ncbi:transcriptional repressor LexA [Thiocapsa bogorovii]|uniref:transcriptional repressor LexA n=1 Tax=Thiocapsa bogorovii TaxID=521689 RepID=UPI001E64B26C|nr:transcriptional repressor LexA [Thiocapsa bogorovii]UHD14836.1 transcriptional repressor LexA [Thiocapsa bogorovii]
MSNDLTLRQQQILELIRSHIRETGVPPTRAEIARTFGFRSANAAEDHLRALARHGAIELTRGRSRGIRLVDQAAREVELPIIGRVAAGSPILAAAHIEDWCQVNPDLFRPRADYLLRVRGNSMCDACILDGDLLAVHITSEVFDGQIVVARLGDEVTVKRLHWQGQGANRAYLLPENPSFEPIPVDLRTQQLVIEGLGVGVIRRFAGGRTQGTTSVTPGIN